MVVSFGQLAAILVASQFTEVGNVRLSKDLQPLNIFWLALGVAFVISHLEISRTFTLSQSLKVLIYPSQLLTSHLLTSNSARDLQPLNALDIAVTPDVSHLLTFSVTSFSQSMKVLLSSTIFPVLVQVSAPTISVRLLHSPNIL